MVNFEHDCLADINLIADNLRDRYKDPFSILKELIQNADDACASNVRFGIAPGSPASGHLLLAGPALVMVNDGAFRKSDFRGICSFGLNSKASDHATIGKFGLGMKSVFHLCEAMFFRGEGEDGTFSDLLSPWGATLRPQWDITETREELLAFVWEAALDAVQWQESSKPFILYLPLRREIQLRLPDGNTAGAIVENYPGDTGLAEKLLRDEGTGAKLASLLPLLRTLSSIGVYLPDATSRPGLVHSAQLEASALRPSRAYVPGESELLSKIRLNSRDLFFAGGQRYMITPRLAEIHSSSAWPISRERDELGRERKVPDKAEPHAAAVWGPGISPGTLTIRWAVFLPVDDQEENVRMAGNPNSYMLTLHGHFFVDAGRNGLYGLEETGPEDSNPNRDEAWIRRNWNRELAGGASLDLVITALDRFSRSSGVTEEQKTVLARAIAQSRMWLNWKAYIAADRKWVRTVENDGSRWAVLEQEATLPIPTPAGDPRLPWRVFPTLDAVRGHAVLYDRDAPHLIVNSQELGDWDPERVALLLNDVDADRVFTSNSAVGFLAEFIGALRDNVLNNASVQNSLCGLLRRAIAARGIPALRGIAEMVQRIAGYVLPSRRIRVATRSIPVAELLVQQETAALVWPREFDSPDNLPAPLVEDIELLLNALARMNDHTDACRQCAEELLKLIALEQRRELLEQIGDLALLSAFDCAKMQRTSVSSNQLRNSSRHGTLFRFAAHGANDRERTLFAPLLQMVLPSLSLLVINRELADLVLGQAVADSIPNCDAPAALRCLAGQSCELGGLLERKELLASVSLPDRAPLTIRGLRFLLHGCPEQKDSEAPLWVEREDALAAWRKLWEVVVPAAESWTVIDSGLAGQLAPAFWAAIDLYPVHPDHVVTAVSERGIPPRAKLRLENAECEALLGYERWEEQTWKSLPLHLTTSGDRVSANNSTTYLEADGVAIPSGLLARATLLKVSGDARLAAIQRRWIPALDGCAAVLLALGDERPEKWCESILNWLGALAPSVNLIRTLADKAWLRTETGRAIKPANFIVLPEVENRVAQLIEGSSEFGAPSQMEESLREHAVLRELCGDLFPRTQCLNAMARLAASSPRLAILDAAIAEPELSLIARLLQQAPEEFCPAAWSLIVEVSLAYGEEQGRLIYRALPRTPPDSEQVKRLLGWLSTGHIRAGAEAAFQRFLGVLPTCWSGGRDDLRHFLRDLVLGAQDGSWKPAAALCHDIPGADKSVLVVRNQAAALGGLLELAGRGTANRENTGPLVGGVCDIREYFRSWCRPGLEAQVGALITLLAGQHASLKEHAANLLDPHTRGWLLNLLPWRIPGTAIAFGGRQPLDGLSLERALEICRFSFLVARPTSVPAFSLIGEVIQVPVAARSPHLLLGRPGPPAGYPLTKVCFREIDISGLSDAELSEMLRTTAEEIYLYVFLQPVDLRERWAELKKTEQFEIRTAERLILDYLPFYLAQLRPQNCPQLTQKLQVVDDHRRLVVEYAELPELPQKKSSYEARRGELRDLLKRDAETQNAVLEAVRSKLRDSQYQPSSIPFELFQNADDACVQLDEIRMLSGIPMERPHSRFVVLAKGNTLSFLHWGRPVNAVGPHDFDGRDRGYHRDLEKMLTLSSSEKQSGAGTDRAQVTGKFGLGFKSILLACARPLVASGSLQFEVVGGVLPKELSQGDARTLRQIVHDNSGSESDACTVVHIPEISEEFRRELLDDFCNWAGYLTAFGLAIREISFIDQSGSHSTQWTGSVIAGLKGIQRGTLPAGRLTENATVEAVRIELSAKGMVLFGLGPEGLRALPGKVPAVWVTGPTREDERFGFAVCAIFDVDPGRARLSAIEDRNLKLAGQLGTQLGAFLRNLFLADWSEIRRDLRLSGDVTPHRFWNSLWKLWQQTATSADSPSRRIMTGVLGTALRDIFADLDALPNGLPGNLGALTTALSVQYKVTGALEPAGCLAALFKWPIWSQRGFRPESLISGGYSEALTKLGFASVPAINLSTVAAWLAGQTIRPEDARPAGELILALPAESEQSEEVRRDLSGARRALSQVCFYSEANTLERAADLISASAPGDEARRAAFAPPYRRLAAAYDVSSREFFRFCRGQMNTPVFDLALWARAADTRAAQQAALEYLVHGDRALELQRELRQEGVPWLSNPADVALLPADLLDELRRPPIDLPETDFLGTYRPLIRNPRAVLEVIEEWWRRSGTEEQRQYDRAVYPHGVVPQLARPESPDFNRSQWLVLFGRAAFYKMGRADDGQHRSFLEFSQSAGYWDVFAAERPESRADEWMDVLERFSNDQIDSLRWEHWMRSFGHLYKLSRWLTDYVDLFLSLDRQNERFDLEAALKPRADVAQQGGGIDAPPPGLGIGACFIIRELLRLGNLHNQYVREYAFVPTQAARNLMDQIGLEIDDEPNVAVSAQIYRQLSQYLDPERATFLGSYDLPFQIIAGDPRLQQRLLYGTPFVTGQGA